MTHAGPDNTPAPKPAPQKGGGLFKAFVFLLLLLLAGASFAAHEAYTFLTTPAEKEGREIIITIAPGATFDRVAWDLKKAGAVTDVDRFRLLARYEKALGKIKAGDFLVNTGWTPVQVLRQITRGQAYLVRLSLREGLTWWQTAKAVEAQGFARYDDFAAVIRDPEFLKAHAIPFDDAEGFLFPDTYLLSKPKQLDRAQAYAVASLLVRTFWKKNVPVWKRLPTRDEPASEGYGSAVADAGNAAQGIPPLTGLPVENTRDEAREASGTGLYSGTGLHTEDNGRQPAGTSRNATSGSDSVDRTATVGSQDAQPGYLAGTGSPATGENSAVKPGVASTTTEPAAPASQTVRRTVNRTVHNGSSLAATVMETGTTLAPVGETPGRPATPVSQAAEKAGENDGHTGNATAATSKAPGNTTAGNITSPPSGQAALYGPDPSLKEGFTPPASPADVSPKALKRLVILASLVERETGVPSERPRVAGVYANRLRLNMLLQCDPTIIYGIGPSFTGSIRRSQLQDAGNLYNTYQHPGLPPGPIGSVGVHSLLAALMPEVHKYLYFVATGADNGHTFSRTLEEHNKAVRVYRSRTRR